MLVQRLGRQSHARQNGAPLEDAVEVQQIDRDRRARIHDHRRTSRLAQPVDGRGRRQAIHPHAVGSIDIHFQGEVAPPQDAIIGLGKPPPHPIGQPLLAGAAHADHAPHRRRVEHVGQQLLQRAAQRMHRLHPERLGERALPGAVEQTDLEETAADIGHDQRRHPSEPIPARKRTAAIIPIPAISAGGPPAR